MTAVISSPPSPAAVLRACSWIGAEAGLARVRNLSSSHTVHIVTRADGAEAIVKRLQESGQRSLSPELFVYRLASWNPELAALLPKALHIDEAAQVLVLEALPTEGRRLPVRDDPAFDRRAGQAIAAVHRATTSLGMLPSLAAGILDVADRPDDAAAGRSPDAAALMHRIADDALLAEALRKAKVDYRISCLIHGDLRPDHFVEMSDGSLRLIDWEMGGGGDPALDLGAAIAEPVLDLLRRGDYEADWMDLAAGRIRAAAEGYAKGGGAISLSEADRRAHVARLAAARLLHVATEWAETGQLGKAVDAVLDQARSLLARQSDLADLIAP